MGTQIYPRHPRNRRFTLFPYYGMERHEIRNKRPKNSCAGLKQLHWTEADLETRPKGHKGKVKLAERVRKETIMTLAWISQRLHMGSWTYVSNLLAIKRRQHEQ